MSCHSNINLYETSKANVLKQASGELYNVSRTSFIKVCIKMTMSTRFFLSHTWLLTPHRPVPGQAFHKFLSCRGYIRLV